MCAISVHTNPIYGWRELDRKSLVKLASCLSWPHLVFGVGTCEVDKVLISPDTKLKDPLASVIAPWLLILIQSVSLEVTQEKALDSADWIKPKQYDPDAKQVNGKEWVGLFVTLEGANGFCICEWSQAESMNTLLTCLSVGLKCQLYFHSSPFSLSLSLPKCKTLTYTTWSRDRERQHTILHFCAHKQMRRYWLEAQLHSHWCSSQSVMLLPFALLQPCSLTLWACSKGRTQFTWHLNTTTKHMHIALRWAWIGSCNLNVTVYINPSSNITIRTAYWCLHRGIASSRAG